MAVGAPEGLGTTKVSVRLGGGVNFLLPQRTLYEAPNRQAPYLRRRSCFSMFGVVDSHAGYREECSSDTDQ
jgi:hypothetical protein